MPDIYETSQAFRARLLRRERQTVTEIRKAYKVAERRLLVELASLTAQIEQAIERGETVNPSWLFRQERYQALLFQIQREIGIIARRADRRITAAQGDAVTMAVSDAASLTVAQAVTVDFNRLNKAAVEHLVGNLSDGSPLSSLLNDLPRQARTAVSDALIQGVTLGWNPRKTARAFRAALGGNRARAERLSRTETIRAYREATRSSYQENADIISGWRWTASKSARTCLACLSKDGTIYPLNKPMAQHPNCRCQLVCVLIDAPLPDIETGAAWFERQPDSVKAQMMPKIAFDAYKEGSITLKDFEGHKHHPRWGESVYQRSYREITQFPRVVRAAGA